MLSSLLRRLSYLVRHRQMDAELADELSFHQAMKQAELERSGLPPERAAAASRRALGNGTRAREDARAVWTWRWLDGLARDLRYAARGFRRDPGFTAIVLLTLTLGIGASSAMFSIVYATVLNPSATPHAERFVSIRIVDKSDPDPRAIFLTSGQLLQLRASDVVEDAAANDIWPMTLTGADLPENLTTWWVSANALTMYGMPPLLGRLLTESDGPAGQEPRRLVVLTYRFWQRHFGGRQDAIGQTLQLNHESYSVIGVLRPEDFPTGPEIIVPIHLDSDPRYAWSVADVKLKRGVDTKLAEAKLQPLFEQFAKEAPLRFPKEFRVEVKTLLEMRRAAPYVLTLVLLSLATALLVLLACVNVSILLLARGGAREAEFAVRAAIGASRHMLVKQLLAESLLLALAGCGLGIVAAYWSVPALLGWMPPNSFPALDSSVHVSLPVLLFSVCLAVACALFFGLAPAVACSTQNGAPPARASAAQTTGSREHRRARLILIATQVALTVVVLAGTGAAIRALVGLYRTALGYDPHGVMMATVNLPDGSHADWKERSAFFDRLADNVRDIPGVQGVGMAVYGGVPPRVGERTPIEAPNADLQGLSTLLSRITPEYFSALRIPIVQGRAWTAEESARAAHVAVVNQAMANKLWPNGRAIGQRIHVPSLSRSTSQFVLAAPGADGWFDVIGVVGNTPNAGLHAPIESAVYVPHTAMLGDSLTLVIRTAGNRATMERAVREAVRAADADQPVWRIQTAEDVLANTGWARERFVTLLLLGFGAFALILAAVGLYSVVSYSVSHRVREFGIRTALGATPTHVVRLALGPTIAPVAIGLAAGLVLSAASNAIVARWSIGNLSDPIVLATISLVLLTVATAAALLPARRVASIPPATALRSE
jgi:putative ABC transport system permease protein